jgi:hypothetical protein
MLRLISVRDGDRGAITIIVAMLFGFGVMLGLAALTIDVGNINANRRQLQNGADAVALAAVKICVETGVCPDTSNADLQKLQNANANPLADSGVTGIRRVDGGTPICGHGGGLPACSTSASLGNLQECPVEPPVGTNYLRVYTETTDTHGKNLLPYSFGAAIAGVGPGANQQTCASVAWDSGYPADQVVAVTNALCAWSAATNNTPAFPAMPPYVDAPKTSPLGLVPVASKYVVKVLLQGASNSSVDPATCGKNSTSSGQYIAGNFGWLGVKSGTGCVADINKDTGDVSGNTGGPPPNGCGDYLGSKIGSVIYMPIFTKVVGSGGNTVYTVDGVSAFFLAGFQAPTAKGFSNAYATTGLSSYNYCLDKNVPRGPKADNGCLWGWYLSPLVPAGTISEGTTRGPILIRVNG